MKIMITGAAGQLGHEIQRQLNLGKSALGDIPYQLQQATVFPVDVADADITNQNEIMHLIRKNEPDVVIHCAAYTSVDKCETDRDTAFKVNALGSRNVAMACELVGAKMIHVSTDYVFSGTATEPVSEADLTMPQSVYGTTKLLAEQYVRDFCSRWFIVRTAWLYGREGNNFVKTIVRLAKEQGSLKVVNDQVGNPTNAEDLTYHMLQLAATEEYGVYHCTGNGICSWYDFAVEIVRLAGVEASIAPVGTDEFPRPAKRPAYSALDHTMLRSTVGDKMRSWQDALADYFKKM